MNLVEEMSGEGRMNVEDGSESVGSVNVPTPQEPTATTRISPTASGRLLRPHSAVTYTAIFAVWNAANSGRIRTHSTHTTK